MKYIKLFEEFVSEGVYDPGILRAFFMAGGPGSGKSDVTTELFDFPKGEVGPVSYATGLKLVNNDNAFEKGLKDAGYSPSQLAELTKLWTAKFSPDVDSLLSFPISFPTACVNVQVTGGYSGTSGNSTGAYSVTTSGFSYTYHYSGTTDYWLAVGYWLELQNG